MGVFILLFLLTDWDRIIGVANAMVVGVGALVLGVPLAGTIAIVTCLGGYVPYLGAFVSGAFAVVIAYGAGGFGSR